jgi:hypothetical protein
MTNILQQQTFCRLLMKQKKKISFQNYLKAQISQKEQHQKYNFFELNLFLKVFLGFFRDLKGLK